MSLYLFDFGRFRNMVQVLNRKSQHRRNTYNVDSYNSDNQSSSEPKSKKDEVAEDLTPSKKSVCKGHQYKPNTSNRHMSVPQITRNPSILKGREQRITSVVGMPHRHHITIAVNDEPVDIIKTTCSGPCLETQSGITRESSSKKEKYQKNTYFESDPRNKNKATNLIILTLVYVISTICVRSIITLYCTILVTTSFQQKITLSAVYFFGAITVFVLSLNSFTNNISQMSSRIKLVSSLFLVILWSALHLIPKQSWFLTIIIAVILGIGLNLFWSCHVQLLSKWSYTPLPHSQIHSLNEIVTQPNILSTTTVISYSMHIWSNILIFILIESVYKNLSFRKRALEKFMITQNTSNYKMKMEWSERSINTCGIINDYTLKGVWQQPNEAMFYLHYVCISLNVLALILVVLLLDKSRSIRIPSNSLDKDTCHSMIDNNENQLPTLCGPNDNSNDNFYYRQRNYILTWGKIKINILIKLWKFERLKYIFPSLLSMGLVEGFFVTDYNERFVSCFHKSSFIGISMLSFAIGPIMFVNIFQMIIRYPLLEIITSPISRILVLVSSLILGLTNVGHHWTYLLVFYPSIIALDAVICLAIFYANVANIPDNLSDNSIVIHRFLRLLGISIYVFTSGVSSPFVASMITVIAHCFISPAIIIVAYFQKDEKN